MSEYGTMAVDGCNVATATEQIYLSHVITSHCSLSGGNLTDTGTVTLARALQDNKSLEELKWVVN